PLGGTAAAIRARGLEAGLWTAPFHAAPESAVFRAHPEWFVRGRDGAPLLVRGFTSPLWATLDASRPDVRAHLAETFRTLRDAGFSYFKLDALGFAIPDGVFADSAATPVSAFRAGLAAIREAVPDAWLLGCGAHHLATLGLVDANRLGGDTAAESGAKIEHAALQTLAKFWTFGRWFAPDPDVVVVRESVPDGAARVSALAAILTGCAISGDRVEQLPPERLALLGRAARLRVRDVRPAADVEPSLWPRLFFGSLADGRPAAAVLNSRDAPFEIGFDALDGFPRGAPVEELLHPLGRLSGRTLAVPPHDAALLVPAVSA
ncbi:MAG: alpha-galactosidase, partial [Kiritimatiellae bacterium]|nr:alpha-galactosidase [Kiritimatiellia bacterium]